MERIDQLLLLKENLQPQYGIPEHLTNLTCPFKHERLSGGRLFPWNQLFVDISFHGKLISYFVIKHKKHIYKNVKIFRKLIAISWKLRFTFPPVSRHWSNHFHRGMILISPCDSSSSVITVRRTDIHHLTLRICGFAWIAIFIFRQDSQDWLDLLLSLFPPARHREPLRRGGRGQNREMAIPLSAGKKSQRSRLYYCRKNSLEEGFKFLPFFRKGKKSWESCRSCLSKRWRPLCSVE